MSGDRYWRESYQRVLASKEWRLRRERRIAEREGCCERCGSDLRPLELHHKTYERLGKERDSDLELVCDWCHVEADAERAFQGQRRARNALENARLNGWATKKYGENWQDYDDGSIEEEFNDWRERRNW